METKIFLKKVLGDGGYYAVMGFKGEHTKQKFYDSIDDVVTASKNLDIEGYETYFGLATFETADSRRVDNIKSISSFYLDLDRLQ